MASCPHCGRRTGSRDRFCDGCGAFLGWDAAESADSQLLPEAAARRDDQRAGVQLQLKDDLINVTPGNSESTAFTVKNLGTQVEEFRFTVTGPEWITAEPAALSVYPGQEQAGTIRAAPPRSPGSVAGVTPYRLTATSAVHVGVSSTAAGRVDVAPYYELGAELAPTSSRGRGLTRHQITLDNRGNVPLRVTLKPADAADGLRIGVPTLADLPPGRVVEVPVSVYGSRRWFGRPEPKSFSISAEAPKPLAATRLSGTRILVPLFPRWVPAAAGLLAAAVVGTGFVLNSKGPGGSGQGGGSHSVSSSVPHSISTSVSSSMSSSISTSVSSSMSSSVSTSVSTSASTSVSTTVNLPPPMDLFTEASSATWTSSPSGLHPSVVATSGCQAGVAVGSQGAVYDLPQVTLADGTTAQNVLEIDPPAGPMESPSGLATASISGLYTFSPLSQNETFNAELGFCQGAQPGATLQYQVLVQPSQQTPQPPQTIEFGTGAPTPIHADVPAGTTQITLSVLYSMDTKGVVWVDPRIAA